MLTSRRSLIAAVFLLLLLLVILIVRPTEQPMMPSSQPRLLSEPFLQLPSSNSIRVVWFTEFAGSSHTVTYGENLKQTAVATTTKLSRTREDQKSNLVVHNQQYAIFGDTKLK